MSDIDPYYVHFTGGRLDPYRVARLFGITDPALSQALKKLLRAGSKHKTVKEDIHEVITSCQRFLAMEEEDERIKAQQQGPPAPPPPPAPKRMTCPDCGKPSLPTSDYCANCIHDPGPR